MDINTIFNIDCIEGFKRLPPGCVDVIVTSPPYNLGKEYNLYKDDISRTEYLEFISEIAVQSKRVLSDSGSFFLNVGGSLKDPWIPFDVASRFRKEYVLQNTIHWIKSIAIQKEDVGNYGKILDDVAVGHYKPINSNRFHNDHHEYIFHFTKRGDVVIDRTAVGVSYQDKTNIKRWRASNGADKRDRGNTWFIPYETIKESRPHPCMFPVKLPEMCIRDHGLERVKLVLDPFIGIGTTAVAAKKLGVDYIGFEIDPEYIKIAEEKLERG